MAALSRCSRFFCIFFSSFEKPIQFCAAALFGFIFYIMFRDSVSWQWLFFWLIGTAADRLITSRCLSMVAGFVGLIAVALALIAARTKVIPLLASDTVIAVGFAVAISSRLLVVWHWWPKATGRLAAFSYSLYAIHLPVVVFSARMLEWLGWASPVPNRSLEASMDFGLSVSVAVFAAIGFAAMTEARTDTVRRIILNCRHSPDREELASLKRRP